MGFRDEFGKKLLFCDGALGTVFQSMGLPAGKRADHWSIEEPSKVIGVHKAYLEVGCNIITANTFGAAMGGVYSAEEIVENGVRNARTAVDSGGKNAYVALDISSLGEMLEPFGTIPFEKAYEAFARVVRAGEASGADLVLIETMTDTYEIKAALLAAKENCSLPVVVTFTIDENGRLMNGADIVTAAALIESLGADGVGMNCGFGAEKMLEFAPQLLSFTKLPVLINPNAGMPVIINGKATYDVTSGEFAADLEKLVDMGCSAVGGCCGTTPEILKSAVAALKNKQLNRPEISNRPSFISSRCKTVFFGERTVLIGERINPTGKPKLKAALREENYDYLCDEAARQYDAGADVLDVNVGISEIDETSVLPNAVNAVQAVTVLPLQIDTSNAVALEKALRIYNGKPLINSVNGSRESLSSVLPLAAKYGAMVVGLTLDENGIPSTADGRIAIAEKIINEAAKYGIDKSNIIIDPLTLTISTAENGAMPTLDALEYIKNTLGVHTVLGVSNVSFGLPCREKINASFFILAMQRGLSAGIINPLNSALMDSYRSFNALYAYDKSCLEYIESCAEAEPAAQSVDKADSSLSDFVIKGLCGQAAAATEEMLKTTPSMEIINNMLIPALDEVGKRFEKKTLFLPQLLLSAKAASAAFDIIKERLKASGEKGKSKGKIVIATVKDDIHDIGKNIVKVLLENYDYEVIDLGRNVSPETVVQTVTESNVKLVGLSALMTTTVPNMEKTIAMLREKCDCRIMVGGAVLTEEYSKKIGADVYCADAMASVRFAEKMQGEGLL